MSRHRVERFRSARHRPLFLSHWPSSNRSRCRECHQDHPKLFRRPLAQDQGAGIILGRKEDDEDQNGARCRGGKIFRCLLLRRIFIPSPPAALPARWSSPRPLRCPRAGCEGQATDRMRNTPALTGGCVLASENPPSGPIRIAQGAPAEIARQGEEADPASASSQNIKLPPLRPIRQQTRPASRNSVQPRARRFRRIVRQLRPHGPAGGPAGCVRRW